MAMPENQLSTQAVPSSWTGSAAMASTRSVFFQDGGLKLQDPSQGITGQIWRMRIEGNTEVYLEADTVPEYLLFTGTAVTDVTFAFDQNMNLYYSWVDLGVCYLRYYDSQDGTYKTMNLGPTVITPKLVMDDKRDNQSAASDVIFAYVKDGSLMYRQQRERFSIERMLAAGPFLGLERIGMNTGNRLQFQLVTP